MQLDCLMELLDLLDLVIASHEDARSIMDSLRNNLEHASHIAIDGLTSSYILLAHNRYSFTESNVPFSKTMAIGAHSYRIRSFPLGLFLSAG